MTIGEITEKSEEITENSTENTEENSPVKPENNPNQSNDKIKSKRSIRTEKQLEALAIAREKAFAVRREKAERKKQELESKKEKQSDNQTVPEPEVEVTSEPPTSEPPTSDRTSEPDVIDKIKEHTQRVETKRNLTMSKEELDQLIANTVNVTLERTAKPKKKYKLINGVYVLQ